MEEVANFLHDLLRGLDLIALSMAVGGVVWGLFGLRAWRRPSEVARVVVERCVTLLYAGAIGVALAQVMRLAVKSWILMEALARSPFPALFHTLQFRVGLSRALLAIGLAVAGAWLLQRPDSRRRWASVSFLAALLVLSGAWLVHAAGRVNERATLMLVTTFHQLSGAVWLGGLVQLGAIWSLARLRPELGALWPTLLGRFSVLGMGAVLLLLTTGLMLARSYVGTWQGLIGTGYGTLVLAKTVLLTVALGFAALDFHAARGWRQNGVSVAVHTQVPPLIEVETVVLSAILLAAVALSSQPPAVDTPDEQATWSEVVEVFRPKWPRLLSPSHEAVLAGGSVLSAAGAGERTRAASSWSNFNHNIAGAFLLVMGVFALAARLTRLAWARHWPIGFVALAGMLVFRSDPDHWPLGPIGFWEGFLDAGVLQHRLATILAFALGLLEWRARTSRATNIRLRYLFPVLSALGGVLLLTHSHSAFELKSDFLRQLSHTAMGVLAVLVACGRWLELRLPQRAGRVASLVANVALLLAGAILIFYREPMG